MKLIHVVRGDLDWIVMKCLEKDRTRRYETANGLGADVQRHLKNEPVLAGPPSQIYRLQKMVRRNKLAFAAAAAVALALGIGIIASTWQARRAVSTEATSRATCAASGELKLVQPRKTLWIFMPYCSAILRCWAAASGCS